MDASPPPANVDIAPPANVWFVRATADQGGPPPTNVVDGVTLVDGDRIAVVVDQVPRAVYEWNDATHSFSNATLPPDDVLVVAEKGTLRAGRGWWQKKGLTYHALVAKQPHIIGKSNGTIDLTSQQSWGTTAVGTWHVLVMLIRNMDGLYAPSPMATGSNFYDNPRWLVPLSTSDATDRVYLAGLTDGLVEFECIARFRAQKRKSRTSM